MNTKSCPKCNSKSQKLGRMDDINKEGLQKSYFVYLCKNCNDHCKIEIDPNEESSKTDSGGARWPRHCLECRKEFRVEVFCPFCGEGLEFGRLAENIEKEKDTQETCGYCGRAFKFGEKFCGRCQTAREEATKIKKGEV